MQVRAREEAKRPIRRVLIREADLDADRSILIDAFYRYLTPLSDSRRFDWLYRENPDGRARVWIAYDPDENTIVGSGTAIPRRLRLGNAEVLSSIMADFWIHPHYRTLGPALQLQRACLASVDSGSYALCFDFPKPNMVAVYRRLGVVPGPSLVRWAKPLRLDGWFSQRVTIPFLATCLIKVGNRLLELCDRRLRRSVKYLISPQEDACDEEFTALSRAVSKDYGVCVARTAAYLNWRYHKHFHHRHSMLTARRGGVLLGYAVYVEDQGSGQIVDLFGADEPGMLQSLIAKVVAIFRQRGIPLVSAPLLGPDFSTNLFKRCGFYPREASPVIVYAPPGVLSAHANLDQQKWFLMQGDRES